MAGLDDIISNNAFLRNIANAVGMRREVEVPAELSTNPRMERYKDDTELKKDPFKYLPRSTIPEDLPSTLASYRADPAGRFGGNEGLETQPIPLFVKNQVGGEYNIPDIVKTNPQKAIQELYRMARINGAAEKYGLPAMTSDEIGAFVLKEGRSDLGFNSHGLSPSNVKYKNEILGKYNIPDQDAGFLTAIAEKRRVADKLQIPFAHAWNGVGINEKGTSGADYAKDWQNHRNALYHEKNKPLMNLINRAIEDGKKHGFPLIENEIEDQIPKRKKVPYKAGGTIDKPIVGGKKDIF